MIYDPILPPWTTPISREKLTRERMSGFRSYILALCILWKGACFSPDRIMCGKNSCPVQPLRMSDAGQVDPGNSIPSGLYDKFSSHCWIRLEESGLFQPADIPNELQMNEAPAKGTEDGVVRITTKAMVPKAGADSIVQYARVALLETTSESDPAKIQTQGIQVLNFVVIPSESTALPVLGIDLVSLPGNKHLLLMDAQPMTHPNPFESHWHQWHDAHVRDNSNFPWGGDFPEAVQPYVSPYALWTRLQGAEDPVGVIQQNLWDAFVEHLDIYLDLLQGSSLEKVSGGNHQPSYLEYRRNNDPAKPMLNALYGVEWTDSVLDQVLFPL